MITTRAKELEDLMDTAYSVGNTIREIMDLDDDNGLYEDTAELREELEKDLKNILYIMEITTGITTWTNNNHSS